MIPCTLMYFNINTRCVQQNGSGKDVTNYCQGSYYSCIVRALNPKPLNPKPLNPKGSLSIVFFRSLIIVKMESLSKYIRLKSEHAPFQYQSRTRSKSTQSQKTARLRQNRSSSAWKVPP